MTVVKGLPLAYNKDLQETQEPLYDAVETLEASGVGDPQTSANMRNWMECVRSRKTPHAPVEAGYAHSIAVIMANAAAHTGSKVVFDETTQEVMVEGKPFRHRKAFRY